jgi:hypothetical protein
MFINPSLVRVHPCSSCVCVCIIVSVLEDLLAHVSAHLFAHDLIYHVGFACAFV